MSNKAKLYQKLARLQSAVSMIPKTGKNKHQNYTYVEEGVLLDHIRPLLLENGLVFFSNVLETAKEGKFVQVKMEFTLADIETGEELKLHYWGEGMDGGDKAYYKAYTGATKYFFMKTLLISSGDDVEKTSPEKEQKKQDDDKALYETLLAIWTDASGGTTKGLHAWYEEQKHNGYKPNEIIGNLKTLILQKKQEKKQEKQQA